LGRRGVNLLEVVLSLALFVITVTGTVVVMKTVLDTSRRQDEAELDQERFQVTWDDLASGARQATVWISPALNDLSAVSVLEFELPDMSQESQRWPFPVPVGSGSIWNPREPSRQCRLRYEVAAGGLRQTLTRGSASQQTVAPGVTSLRVQRSQMDTLSLRLSYAGRRGLKSVEGQVRLPMRRCWAR
jgi:type II secretory pathway component PulJ